jgi:hypothetical protein
MDDSQTIHRYEVPRDNLWHPVEGCDTPLSLGARRSSPAPVEFWARANGGDGVRWFRVYGTGHPVPGDATYRGSVIVNGGMFVWHLFEMIYPPEGQKAPA